MCPCLIEIGSKTAEKNSAQTNRQTNRQTDKPTDTTKIMVTWPWTKNSRFNSDASPTAGFCNIGLVCHAIMLCVSKYPLRKRSNHRHGWQRPIISSELIRPAYYSSMVLCTSYNQTLVESRAFYLTLPARGVQNVRSLTWLITRYVHHILSLFNIASRNWNALGPTFLLSSDAIVDELLILLF